MRPIALRIVDRDDQRITLRNRVQIKILRFRSEVRRPLGSTSVNVQTYLVGRPGLDPGTLGFEPERTEASVVVRVAWSEECASPPTSADVLANLLPWLHDWLHSLGSGVSSVVQISGSDGLKIEVRV
jgi:hypothetical protein